MLSCIAISCTQNLEEGAQDNGGNLLHRLAIGLTEPELLSIAYDSNNDLSEEAATDILADFIAENNVSISSMPTFCLKTSTPSTQRTTRHVLSIKTMLPSMSMRLKISQRKRKR